MIGDGMGHISNTQLPGRRQSCRSWPSFILQEKLPYPKEAVFAQVPIRAGGQGGLGAAGEALNELPSQEESQGQRINVGRWGWLQKVLMILHRVPHWIAIGVVSSSQPVTAG